MRFSIVIHSMGSWVMNPTLKWEGKKENAYHDLDIDTWSFLEVVNLIHNLEYFVTGGLKMSDVDYETLRDLSYDQDIMDFARYALSHKCAVDIYVVFGVSDYEEVTEDKVRGELTRGKELFNDQQIVVFDHNNVMAFDDNGESSRKQNEPRVKSKVSNKGKQKASGYEDSFVENPGQCDEDPNRMDDDNMSNPPHEEPYTNFKEMHDLEIGYEIEELYSNVEFEDDTTKPGKKFWMFRKETMSKAFKRTLGMQFTSLQDFKEGMMECPVLNGYQVVCKTNKRPFTAYVYRVGETTTFQLKTLELITHVPKFFTIKMSIPKWVAKVLLDKFRTSKRFTLPQIVQEMKSTYVVGITRSCAIFARKLALHKIEGDAIKQYTLLRRYNSELISINANNTFKIHVNRHVPTLPPRFGSFYMCMDACKSGFVDSCKPFIGVDDCHLKTRYGGHSLVVVTRDANDQYYPLAFVVVETENKESWKWFLNGLLTNIGDPETYKWVLIFDRQKALVIGSEIPIVGNTSKIGGSEAQAAGSKIPTTQNNVADARSMMGGLGYVIPIENTLATTFEFDIPTQASQVGTSNPSGSKV
ncbi:hypothetical protein HKD37_04G009347 [Glycine soja]